MTTVIVVVRADIIETSIPGDHQTDLGLVDDESGIGAATGLSATGASVTPSGARTGIVVGIMEPDVSLPSVPSQQYFATLTPNSASHSDSLIVLAAPKQSYVIEPSGTGIWAYGLNDFDPQRSGHGYGYGTQQSAAIATSMVSGHVVALNVPRT